MQLFDIYGRIYHFIRAKKIHQVLNFEFFNDEKNMDNITKLVRHFITKCQTLRLSTRKFI